MEKKSAIKKKSVIKTVKPEMRILEIKARMFDLTVHRDTVNNQVGQELQTLNNELVDLTTK